MILGNSGLRPERLRSQTGARPEKDSQIKESFEEVLPSGHHFYNSGNGETRSNGTGFLVHKSISSCILEYQGISDRLAMLKLQGKENKIVLWFLSNPIR